MGTETADKVGFLAALCPDTGPATGFVARNVIACDCSVATAGSTTPSLTLMGAIVGRSVLSSVLAVQTRLGIVRAFAAQAVATAALSSCVGVVSCRLDCAAQT
jgi:hypothetical protein